MKREQKYIPREPLKFLWMIGIQWKWMMLGALSMITLATAVGIGTTYMTKLIVDEIEWGVVNMDLLWKYVVILGLLYFLINPLWRASGLFGSVWSEWSSKRSYNLLLDKLIYHGDQYFGDRFAGAVANKIAHVSDGLFHIFTGTLWWLYSGFMTMILSLVIACSIDWYIGGVYLVWIVLFFLLARWMLPKKRVLSYAHSENYSKLKWLTVDLITNAWPIRQFVRFGSEKDKVQKITDVQMKLDLKSWWYSEWMRFVYALMNHGITIISLAVWVWLWSKWLVTAGDMLLVFWLAEKISNELREIGTNFDGLMKNYGQIDEGLDELLVPYDIIDTSDREIQITGGEIRFDEATFGYHDALVFNKLNLAIWEGEKIGLVWESGAGKSTFVQLLLRQYDLESGAILFDDQDISHVTQDSLRMNIAYIPQDPSLFHRTINENIWYGLQDASDEQIEHAARLAQAHDFIDTLPKWYETLVGERWVKLSGGQRQRIVIARAILKNAPILILDEATSALDSESEQKIQEALHELMKWKTVIAIAHRLSTIKHLDRILVFDGGKIVEDGSHEDLIKEDGRYAKLWNAQSWGFLSD